MFPLREPSSSVRFTVATYVIIATLILLGVSLLAKLILTVVSSSVNSLTYVYNYTVNGSATATFVPIYTGNSTETLTIAVPSTPELAYLMNAVVPVLGLFASLLTNPFFLATILVIDIIALAILAGE
ncbi:MAG: hypothetical protein C0179_03975 [Fervidicoccus sp.]|nr:MAG: hypothetical protein C0179_03975 [Fervidicoccus sp.]